MKSLATAAAPPPIFGSELRLSAQDFSRIAAIAQREFGLFLPENKRDLVRSRLQKLLAQTGCPDVPSFCDRVEQDPDGAERSGLISALTTNVTHFFREEHHFRLLTEQVLRPAQDRIRTGGSLRLWSAGCSAGQEPRSMAMTLLDLFPNADQLNIRILATDIDPAILARAKRGEYSLEEAEGIPARLRSTLTEPAGPGSLRLVAKVNALIRFGELNLMSDWPMRGKFDAIFCRNVAIYFDKPTQARLWQRFADHLLPGGLLCIGHSERLGGSALDVMGSAGITAYRLNTMGTRQKGTGP